jgi:hypothetical protein
MCSLCVIGWLLNEYPAFIFRVSHMYFMCTSCVVWCIACVPCMWMMCVNNSGHMLIGITCIDQTCIDQGLDGLGANMSGFGIACECF